MPRRGPGGLWREIVLLGATAAVLGTALPIAGCARRPRPVPLAELEATEVDYLGGVVAGQQRVHDVILARWEREWERVRATPDATDQERIFDILVLSGGGPKGAFGSAFLLGWGEVTDPAKARPVFDLVTGVSTGSLIAPMAFVGSDESYRVAYETYRNPSPDWIRERSILDILLNEDSIYDDEGLLRTVHETIGRQVPAIAQGGRDNRVLLVSAANLNQGLTRVWNLTDLANAVEAGELGADEFARINLSSASIPVAFPPQVIDGNVYVDGSTTGDILFYSSAESRSGILAEWKRRHPDVAPPKIRVWVIANTPLATLPSEVDTRSVAIAARSLDLAVKAGLLAQLKIIELESRLYREVLGAEFEFRFVAMPDFWTAKGKGMFNRQDMQEMSEIGVAMGRDPASWRKVVPEPLSPTELRLELERRLDRQASRGASS